VPTSDPRIARICERIVAHTERHPAASDTVYGIARFWLGNTAPPALVARALRQLVRDGRIYRKVGRDRRNVRYSRKPA
jgi:hypothetical protein